ncbi:MAG TPA: single-stranded DNA-binding protein [Nocardioidaceae bacterium]|nr:single-stranded DNA-binding protein [Nocardioidaceae bacterium]
MTDTLVTLHGWVGGDVVFRTPKDVSVASFRVACTPRVRRDGKWEDGETTWYSVTAWRSLAENVRDSVHRGEAVIVHGRLRSRTWTRGSGEPENTVLEVDALLVGHDLTRGTSAFLKKQRSGGDETDLEAEVAGMLAAAIGDETPLDSWGNPKSTPQFVTESPAEPVAETVA